MFVNVDAWNGLDEQAQNCLRSSAMLAEVAGTTRARELTGWYLSQLAANGMSVQAPGEQLMADLAEIGTTMSAEWAEAAGAAGAEIVSAYKAD